MENAVIQGKRPEIPHGTPDNWKKLMEACWHADHKQRPSFEIICRILNTIQPALSALDR